MSRFVSLLVLTAYCLVSVIVHAGYCPLRITENGLGCGSQVLCDSQLRGSGTICHLCDSNAKPIQDPGSKHQENSNYPGKCPSNCPDDCAGCHFVNQFKTQVIIYLPPSIDSLYRCEERCSEITAVIPFDFTLRPNPRGPPSRGTCS